MAPIDQAAKGAEQPATEVAGSRLPARQPPFFLWELALPEDMQKVVEQSWRRTHCRKEWQKREVEDGIKLSWFYAGKTVAYTPTKQGLLILAIGNFESDVFWEQVYALRREDSERPVVAYSPWPWNDDVSRIG